MTTRITKQYSLSPTFKVNYTEVPDAVLVAAYHLNDMGGSEPARALLASHGLDEEEVRDVLFALSDLGGDRLRTYSVDEHFLKLLAPKGILPESGNPVEPPKLTVVLRGGVVQYIAYDGEDTPATPKADVIDLDDHEPTWSQEDLQRIEGQVRVW